MRKPLLFLALVAAAVLGASASTCYGGPNVFSNLRFDTKNAEWNTRYGTTNTFGVKFATASVLGQLKTNNANGLCGGANVVGSSTNHFDKPSRKRLWGC